MVWGHLEKFGSGQGTLGEARDGPGEPLGGLIWVGDPQGSMTGRGTREEVRDGSGDPR